MNKMERRAEVLKQFDEHPYWEDQQVPGEYTLVAAKA